MNPRRSPLDKARFLEGNRQKWAVVLILLAGGVLIANVYAPHVEPAPYLGFLTTIGAVFLLGMSVDSALKINKAPPRSYDEEPNCPAPEEGRD